MGQNRTGFKVHQRFYAKQWIQLSSNSINVRMCFIILDRKVLLPASFFRAIYILLFDSTSLHPFSIQRDFNFFFNHSETKGYPYDRIRVSGDEMKNKFCIFFSW